ncbi:MAG: potassium-transporting ATPase subunit KdpC [Vulcanimicrobiaceae bacterium]
MKSSLTLDSSLSAARQERSNDSTLRHLGTAAIYTVISVVLLGIVYPLAMTGVALLLFPQQANGSLVVVDGKTVGSRIIGQLWTKPRYFQGRPSAAGKGYDPTQTGGTNLAPTSKKLIDATRSAIAALKKENPDATGPIPMDLVTSSASGIDPDITPEAAYYQVPRVAKARGLSAATVSTLVAAHVDARQLGVLGEPRVNVLELNLALDEAKK